MVMILYVLYLATLASGNFVSLSQTSTTPNVSNICIFSADPAKFAPKCFVCRNDVYPKALKTCVNGSIVMPKNISYSQADCISGNCGINYPTAPPPAANQLEKIIKSALEYLLKTRSRRALDGSPDNIEDLNIDDIVDRAHGITADRNRNRFEDLDSGTIVDDGAVDLGDGKLGNTDSGTYNGNTVDMVMEQEVPDDLQGFVFRVVQKVETFASDMEDEEVEDDEDE